MGAVQVLEFSEPFRGEINMPKRWTYAQIADDLQARITSGEYPPGSQIPTYRSLSKMYAVHATTAAKAVARLRDRGVVEGAPGRGVYVVEADNAAPSEAG